MNFPADIIFEPEEQLPAVSYLKAVLESFAHQIQSYRIDAGIQWSHVNTNVVHHKKKAVWKIKSDTSYFLWKGLVEVYNYIN